MKSYNLISSEKAFEEYSDQRQNVSYGNPARAGFLVLGLLCKNRAPESPDEKSGRLWRVQVQKRWQEKLKSWLTFLKGKFNFLEGTLRR